MHTQKIATFLKKKCYLKPYGLLFRIHLTVEIKWWFFTIGIWLQISINFLHPILICKLCAHQTNFKSIQTNCEIVRLIDTNWIHNGSNCWYENKRLNWFQLVIFEEFSLFSVCLQHHNRMKVIVWQTLHIQCHYIQFLREIQSKLNLSEF